MNLTADFFSDRKVRTYLLLILAPVLIYFKGLFYPFSPLDEQWLILHDVAFLEKWSNVFGAFKESIQKIYYRPVFNISLILDYHIGHLNPVIYHITNLLLHLLAIILLFRLLVILKVNTKTSFFLTLLFSVHPILVHAVEWIPGRNDTMLCVFSLLSFIYLIRYVTDQKKHYYFLHLLFFLLALFTKETAIVLPVAFIILFLIFKKTDRHFIFLPSAWLAGLILWYIARNSVVSYFPNDSKETFFINLKEFLFSLLTFTGKTLFPVYQSVTPTPANTSLISGLAAIGILLFLYYKFSVHNKKLAFSGIFIFLLFLIMPVWYGALSPLGEQYEHRIYMPLTGLVIFLSQLKINVNSKVFSYVMILIFVLFSIKTFFRIDVYKSDLSYLDEGIHDCPENYVLHFQKGNILYARHEFYPAVKAFSNAIERYPNRPQLFHNRGNAYYELGKYKEAIADYSSALKLATNNPAVLLSRCNAYNKNNDMNGAMQDLNTLKQCCKDVVPASLNQKITERWFSMQFAIINTTIAKKPDMAGSYITRAKLFFNIKQLKEALADLKKACELEPGNALYQSYYSQLASAYKR